jgi:hypothetical protein
MQHKVGGPTSAARGDLNLKFSWKPTFGQG